MVIFLFFNPCASQTKNIIKIKILTEAKSTPLAGFKAS